MLATTDQPPKDQPWKAHWSPVDQDSMTANQNYLVDDDGFLLIDGCNGGGFHAELACARKETKKSKAQPWKAHWSPVDEGSMTANQNYLVDDAGSLLIDGVCGGEIPIELACARKEIKASKTQRWKAHWSPVDEGSMTANQNYRVDDADSLLIDGIDSGHPYIELACSRKEIQVSKTQPWKAHWSPVDEGSMTTSQNYRVDDAGSLLIDGDSGGHIFIELACSRKMEEGI